MKSDKLFIEVTQGMQDLTNLLEKAISVESKLHPKYKALIKSDMSTELLTILGLQCSQLHDAFDRLGEAMHE